MKCMDGNGVGNIVEMGRLVEGMQHLYRSDLRLATQVSVLERWMKGT